MKILITIILMVPHSLSAESKHTQSPELIKESRLKLRALWKHCEKDSDCTRIYHGCYGVASVNRKYQKSATKRAHRLSGDPAVLDCAMMKPSGPIEVTCKKKQCGAWKYPLCTNTDCSKKNIHCRIEIKAYLDRSNKQNYGLRQRSMWGPNKTSCEKKCEELIEKITSQVSSHASKGYKVTCRFEEASFQTQTIPGTGVSLDSI